jgi:dipeptidyl-peptidase-4
MRPGRHREVLRGAVSSVLKCTFQLSLHVEQPVRLVIALLLAGAQQLPGQVPDTVRATVHRLFGTRDFVAERFGPARWIENGAAYTTVESSAEKRGMEIVRYETATGARSVYVAARQLTPAGDSVALDFDDYTWSLDWARLLLFTNTRRVWRQNTRGDYWVLDRSTGRLTKLGGDGPPSTLMYAKFSPAADQVAYVRQGDLYVERLADGAITRLTTGASATLVNGITDWVYEEEFGLRDGFRWSPDGTRIAYWQFDMSGVGTFLLINDTDSLYPFTIPVQYPKVGTSNSAVRVGVVSAAGGPTTWIQVPGDPRNTYLPWMEWAGPGELLIQHMNRRQNADDVLLADAARGAVRTVLAERDSAWVDLQTSLAWLDGGRRFLWTSERDGWRHIYSVSRDGADVRLVTPGDYDVIQGEAVDSAAGMLYFLASPGDALRRYLYRVRLDGSRAAERVTPAGAVGSHAYAISPDGQWALHSVSGADTPPTMDLVRLPSHEFARTLVDNRKLRAAAQPFLARPTEFFTVTVDSGVPLDGFMIRPRDFDSTRTYPVLVYVYGEPAGQTVRDGWGGAGSLWYHALADLGYLVVSFDNQGTPASKGRAWRKSVYGQIGVRSSRQQAEAIRSLARSRRYVDSTRVAIWGWSGGGSSTLQAMFRYPDVYQVGMAVASVADERLYDTIYQERYMGLLPDDSAAYSRASAINQVEGLKGRLLIVHGSGDDNVHYQGDERLVNRLVSLGKAFDFMVYPNRSHCICEGQGTTEHVYQLLTRYLLEHLPAGGR